MSWLNILLPIVTLLIGSGLTILGQALSDRRKETSELRARKEQFKIGNFEVHRSAMLELQELLRDLADSVTAEEVRRKQSGEREFFDSFHSAPDDVLQILTAHLEGLGAMVIPTNGASEEDRNSFIKGMELRTREMAECAEKTRLYAEDSKRYFDDRWPFYDELVKSINGMRLRMYRSGSNTVVRYGEDYIQAVAKWNDLLVSEGSDELREEARKARYRLDRAISNALTAGPYDRFTGDDELCGERIGADEAKAVVFGVVGEVLRVERCQR